MTYDPQQQRPEGQVSNSNRETLNIRQPGESANTGFDWGAVRAAREAAGRSAKSQDPSVGIVMHNVRLRIWHHNQPPKSLFSNKWSRVIRVLHPMS